VRVKQSWLLQFKEENKVVSLEEEARSAVAVIQDLQRQVIQLRLDLQMQRHSPQS